MENHIINLFYWFACAKVFFIKTMKDEENPPALQQKTIVNEKAKQRLNFNPYSHAGLILFPKWDTSQSKLIKGPWKSSNNTANLHVPN